VRWGRGGVGQLLLFAALPAIIVNCCGRSLRNAADWHSILLGVLQC